METDNIACESRTLPKHPRDMTFRGRYRHVDAYLMGLFTSSELPQGTPIHVLDVGCGVLPFGSPTMHDLHEAIIQANMTPVMVGVDTHIPKNIQPQKEIRYQSTIPHESFDVVRLLRVWEHLSAAAYQTLRHSALAQLREGGYFIATQALRYYRCNRYLGCVDPETLGPVIKVAKKIDGVLTPIHFLPDTIIPWPQDGCVPLDEQAALAEYRTYRSRIASGKAVIPITYDTSTLQRFLEQLNTTPAKALNEESPEQQEALGLLLVAHTRTR